MAQAQNTNHVFTHIQKLRHCSYHWTPHTHIHSGQEFSISCVPHTGFHWPLWQHCDTSCNSWHMEVVHKWVNHAPQKKPVIHKNKEALFADWLVCDRIFKFLLVALCLLNSISDLFLSLHYQGMYILVMMCNTIH
jgi:hypothetical protein